MRLTDAIGRYVAYTYDGDHLVSVDQNGRGITRYTYDKKVIFLPSPIRITSAIPKHL